MPLPKDVQQLSPMMRQYMEIKKKNMDKILMYRLGDFYEMFFDDAVTASKVLDLVLTGRDCGLEERAPMCGIPFHACDAYISKLVSKGYKVAICEQMENPALAKGIVKREIIRVITPGTITESSMLDDSENNFIVSVYQDKSGFGLAYTDISTGTGFVTEIDNDTDTVISEIVRIDPKEIICNNAAWNNSKLRNYLDGNFNVPFDLLSDDVYKNSTAEQLIGSYLPADSSELMALTRGKLAMGAALRYLLDTQFDGVSRMTTVEIYSCARFINIPPQTRKNLDLFQNSRSLEKRGSLIGVIDKTLTSMGSRMLKSWMEKPLMDVRSINVRLDAVEELYNDSVKLSKTREQLRGIPDIERLMTKVIYKSCGPRDLLALASASAKLEEIRKLASTFSSHLIKADGGFDTLSDIAGIIENTIEPEPPATVRESGYIRTGCNPEVDELRGIVKNSRAYLSTMEAKIKETCGIKNLKVGYNKVFGYYIEVSKGQVDLVPDTFIRKQTLTTGERYITEELKDLESKILGAGERLNQLEREIYDQLCSRLAEEMHRVQAVAEYIAVLDVICSNAYMAKDNSYVRPEVNDSRRIEIIGGRHPVVEQVMNGGIYVPNDTVLDGDDNLLNIITGPNMAGKSTYMRGTALIVLMAQMGCFVPASKASIGIVDAIFTRIGAADDLYMGDSTFMVEMKEVAYILAKATSRSLVILDEIGRGTSTFDGISIAKAVIDTICEDGGVKARTMFATHYHEVTDMEQKYSCIKNYNIAVRRRGDDIVFLRKIVKGKTDDSYGIEVAKLAGLPEKTIQDAKKYLRESEFGVISGGEVSERAADIYEERQHAKLADEILTQLKELDVDVLTPIESMMKLNDLVKLANSEEDGNE